MYERLRWLVEVFTSYKAPHLGTFDERLEDLMGGDLANNRWSFLDRSKEAEQWSRFTAEFGELRPGLTARDWPAIVEPTPSATFDLSTGVTTPTRATARFDAVNAEAVHCFLDLAEATELVVLDWQHPGYRLDIAAHAVAADGTWRVPVHPDGDYYTFALPDFSERTFGHPVGTDAVRVRATPGRHARHNPVELVAAPTRRRQITTTIIADN